MRYSISKNTIFFFIFNKVKESIIIKKLNKKINNFARDSRSFCIKETRIFIFNLQLYINLLK